MNILRFSDLCDRGQARGQRVFIRADLNVPQDDAGHITEDTRIRASLPCIRMALDAGAAVMVTSHLGRPTEGEFKPEDSLAPVAARLSELLGEGWTGHTLRHRFATEVYRGSKDIRATQALLGHASTVTTQRYTALVDEDLAHAVGMVPGLPASGVVEGQVRRLRTS